jgi:hypothetical protein
MEEALKHPLHKKVAEYLYENLDCENVYCRLIKAPECGGANNIPLFTDYDIKSNATEYCNVDLMIVRNDKIHVIIEIEESDITPTRICGKFLTSVLSNYYSNNIKKEPPIEKNENILFIQILDDEEAKKENSNKIPQGGNLEKSIRSILPIGNITNYNLFYCSKENFEGEKIIEEIKNFIKQSKND